MAMTTSWPPVFDVVANGYVPCNKRRWRDARLVLYRPGYGMVSMQFAPIGIGDPMKERDENGNLKNFSVKTVEYGDRIGDIGTDFANGESFAGLVFWARDRHDVFLSKKTHPSGDIREIAPFVLDEIKWSTEPRGYLLVAKSGEFWERPWPMGYKPKEKK